METVLALTALEIAKKSLSENLTPELIAKITDLDLDFINVFIIFI